jgi:hypothetical protein
VKNKYLYKKVKRWKIEITLSFYINKSFYFYAESIFKKLLKLGGYLFTMLER